MTNNDESTSTAATPAYNRNGLDRSTGGVDVVVDIAGAIRGGAARFVRELCSWKRSESSLSKSVRLIGTGRRLTSRWLVVRELTGRDAVLRVAVNNASFVGGRGHRVVLLRNALHFCRTEEMNALGFTPPKSLLLQTPVVRKLARQADLIVVPCTDMADRVVHHEPSLEKRIVVRGHPVTSPSWRVREEMPGDFILVPVVPAPYKNLDDHVINLAKAMRNTTMRLKVTASPEQVPKASALINVDCLGVIPSHELDRTWARARAVYYPTALESFGYPLAEARAGGRWVIARNTRQNLEIAGDSLVPFDPNLPQTLVDAVEAIQQPDPLPDPKANNPVQYFDWLFSQRPSQ